MQDEIVIAYIDENEDAHIMYASPNVQVYVDGSLVGAKRQYSDTPVEVEIYEHDDLVRAGLLNSFIRIIRAEVNTRRNMDKRASLIGG